MSEQILLEDPDILALLPMQEERSAADAYTEQVEAAAEAERMYMFRGKLYSAGDLPQVCPFLGSLSITDRSAAMSKYEYQGTQTELVEVPVDHPNVTVVRAQKQVLESPLEMAPEATKAEVVISELIAETAVSGGEMPMGGPDESAVSEIMTSSSAVVVQKVKPAVQAKKVLQKIKKPVAVTASQKPVEIRTEDVIAEIAEIAETAESPTATKQPIVSEIAPAQEVQFLKVPEVVNSERVERAEPIAVVQEFTMDAEVESEPIDVEFLSAVEPQLASTVVAIAEHSGAETLEKPKISMMTVETAESVTEYLTTAAPEQAVAVEAIVVLLETAASRLTSLAKKEALSETEASAIVEFIVEWYGELEQRGVSVTEKTAYEFVAQILEEAGVPQTAIHSMLTNWQDGTREFKLQNPHSLSQNVGINTESRSDRWPLGWLYSLVA